MVAALTVSALYLVRAALLIYLNRPQPLSTAGVHSCKILKQTFNYIWGLSQFFRCSNATLLLREIHQF